MLPTSFEQRLLIKNVDRKYYDEGLHKFLELLEDKIKGCLYSVILYGSLAKDSIIPGWSDLDLLIVLDCKDTTQFAGFNNIIQLCSQTIYDQCNIYLSLDVLKKEELPSSKSKIPKLLGNPLIKTHEIKRYGKCVYGKDVFNTFEISENGKLLIIEEYLNILLYIQNYRKFCCQAVPGKDEHDYLTGKIILGLNTILKLLKGYYNILGGRETSLDKRNDELFNKMDPNIPKSQDLIEAIKLRYDIENLKSLDEVKLEEVCNEIITLTNILSNYVIEEVSPLLEC